MSYRTITSKRIVPRSGPSPPKSYWQRPENILTRETCRWCWRATARKSNRRRCCSGKSNSSRSEEHTSELQSPDHIVCRLLLEKKNHTLAGDAEADKGSESYDIVYN